MPASALVASVLLITTSTPSGLDVPAFAAELQRVWRPVAMVAIGANLDAVRPGERPVWLRFADDLGPAAHASALGWIPFTDGVPGTVITVSPSRIRRAVLANADGPRERRAPGDQTARFSRAAARVVAHELGHVLLRTPRHERSGLMRAAFGHDELVAPGPRGFALPAHAGARLRHPEALAAGGPSPTHADAQ